MKEIKTFELAERLSGGYDIYVMDITTITYKSNNYGVYKNGRDTHNRFNSLDEAREYVKEVVEHGRAEKNCQEIAPDFRRAVA